MTLPKRLLVKIGGGKNVNVNSLCKDAALIAESSGLIFVHGASEYRDEIASKLNMPTKTIISPSGHSGVYTDKNAIDAMSMVYSGLINKRLVSAFQKEGVNAIGLSGADGRLLEGIRKESILSVENNKTKVIKDTFTGKATKVNANLLKLLLENRYVPLITQPIISKEGDLINSDNDRNIALIANALDIREVVILFEAQGLFQNIDDPTSLIRDIRKEELDELIFTFSGRIKKKLLGVKEAFDMGVEKVYFGDSRIESPISSALAGKGTVIS